MFSLFQIWATDDETINAWLTHWETQISADKILNKMNLIKLFYHFNMLMEKDYLIVQKVSEEDLMKTLKTQVVSVKVKCIRPTWQNLRDWMADDKNVYIGRKGIVFIDNQRFPKEASRWANPFKGEGAIEKFRDYLTFTEEELNELRGKRLGCWCKEKPDIPCHGDVLVEALFKTL